MSTVWSREHVVDEDDPVDVPWGMSAYVRSSVRAAL